MVSKPLYFKILPLYRYKNARTCMHAYTCLLDSNTQLTGKLQQLWPSWQMFCMLVTFLNVRSPACVGCPTYYLRNSTPSTGWTIPWLTDLSVTLVSFICNFSLLYHWPCDDQMVRSKRREHTVHEHYDLLQLMMQICAPSYNYGLIINTILSSIITYAVHKCMNKWSCFQQRVWV